MGRLKYVVATFVVLQSLHRMHNTKFIVQSFHGHGGRSSTKNRRSLAEPDEQQESPLHYNITNKTANGDDLVGGQYCSFCLYSEGQLCIDRVRYLMSRYKLSEEEALKNEDLQNRCRVPSFYDNKNSYTYDKEPSVIIHAGPHKTGTTALQAFIYDQVDKGGAIFTFDNIRIPKYEELPGVFGKEGIMLNLPHCSLEKYKASGGQMLSPMCDRMRSAFPKFMHDAYNKSEDVLFVAEDFDRIAINNERLHFYLRPYKKIKVVVMYRRLHEWLPSFYNQIMQHYNLVYAKGEEEYPSYVEWLNEHYDEFLDAHAMRVAERYRSQHWVTTVDIINMHEVAETGNLIEYFFCDALDTEATCQAIRDGARPPKSNIGADHDYERLAVKASLGGKISAKFTKPVHLVQATRSLVMKVNEINAADTLPRICPPKQLLDQILATEIEHEKTYFPEWFTSHGGEEGLQQSFDKAVKKKFCSLDADKIIESGMLDSVFKQMA